ncbi:hypothetical protein A3K86_04950 [Photobacterium jeanii]|uniref:Uncharacterized protein n=1 Tax=Photobacterium jeanii TaxID=858640 RepID=A0A178KLI0_9GAMM|nr:hypothetical protein [Photobacterium jeanii]OAN18248.1 hypothetical protein A3K86_04950 [Photobacterium jeanii]PST92074.1 hypothetical protein C9I91_02525 [Photobacterium jeanii]
MPKFSPFLIILPVLLSLSGCVKVMTAEEAAPQLTNLKSDQQLNLAVLDKREYVLSGEKTAAFEGIIRSSLGIPYSHTTATNEPMSVFLSNRLSAGFKKHGIDANVIVTAPNMSIQEIEYKRPNKTANTIVIVLNEWKYDFHAFSDNSWYNMDVVVFDSQGKKKLVKNFAGENDIPDKSSISNEMQLLYKSRFENVFSNSDVLKALN